VINSFSFLGSKIFLKTIVVRQCKKLIVDIDSKSILVIT